MLQHILNTFGIETTRYEAIPLQGGLINNTWKIVSGPHSFILQRINTAVFKKPEEIADNIDMIASYLSIHNPEYFLPLPLKSLNQKSLEYFSPEGYFRLFPYIEGSATIHIVSTAEQAFEAASQFGKFTKALSTFNSGKLHITIPHFHDLIVRYKEFEQAISAGNQERIKRSREVIKELKNYQPILMQFEKLRKDPHVKKRAMHHDTKISNVLFNEHGKGICIIDLDTVMPGYFISDFGDMMRTYLSPASEEEKNFSKIDIREDFFKAILQGYLAFMYDEMTEAELSLMIYAGLFLTYMQALRFFTDYCNNDTYYRPTYEDHNLVRATNQLQLLKIIEEKSEVLHRIVHMELK